MRQTEIRTYAVEVHTDEDGWQVHDSSDSRDNAIVKCLQAVRTYGRGNVRLHTITR